MGLKKSIIENSLSQTLTSVITKLFQFGILAIAARVLSLDLIGTVALAMGYTVFFAPFNIDVGTAIYFKKKPDKKKISQYVGAYLVFEALKYVFVIAVLAIFIVALNFFGFDLKSLFAIGIIVLVTFMDKTRVILSDVLYFLLEQRKVAAIYIIMHIILFALLGLFYFFPSFFFYVMLYFLQFFLIILGLLFCIWRITRISTKNSFAQIKSDFMHFSLWEHLTWFVEQFFWKAQLFFLSFVAVTSALGAFSIAQSTATVALLFIPLVFRRSVMMGFSRTEKHKKALLIRSFKYLLLISTASLVFLLIFSDYIILIVSGKFNPQISFYFIGLAVSVFFMGLTAPLTAFSMLKTKPSKYFASVSLPFFISSLIILFFGAFLFNASGVIFGSILCGLIYLSLNVAYIFRQRKPSKNPVSA
jgi:O-antigen/teichoic acid export membrane protein